MVSMKNKIARSREIRARRKAANKARMGKSSGQRAVAPGPSVWSLWMLSRGVERGVPKRYLKLK